MDLVQLSELAAIPWHHERTAIKCSFSKLSNTVGECYVFCVLGVWLPMKAHMSFDAVHQLSASSREVLSG